MRVFLLGMLFLLTACGSDNDNSNITPQPLNPLVGTWQLKDYPSNHAVPFECSVGGLISEGQPPHPVFGNFTIRQRDSSKPMWIKSNIGMDSPLLPFGEGYIAANIGITFSSEFEGNDLVYFKYSNKCRLAYKRI